MKLPKNPGGILLKFLSVFRTKAAGLCAIQTFSPSPRQQAYLYTVVSIICFSWKQSRLNILNKKKHDGLTTR
jgi:hypothetical protein